MYIRLISFSDVHSPLYTKEFIEIAKKRCSEIKPDLAIVAGDVVERGSWKDADYLEKINDICKPELFVGVFGNDDYQEVKGNIKDLTPSIRWLEEEILSLRMHGYKINIFGSTGILDEPTKWQAKNIPNIHKEYQDRLEKLKNFCVNTTRDDLNIIVMHYPPTHSTLIGEPIWAWSQMGSKKAESVILASCQSAYVFHGHAHNSKRLMFTSGNISFINVAFPARKDVYFGESKPVSGLDKYLFKG